MQLRMEAGLRKYVSDKASIINFATNTARVTVKNAGLAYTQEIWGMWDMDRYIAPLMGEIPRLSDDAGGYGPQGKGFIAHVDIPGRVENAFLQLQSAYAGMVRKANPAYAARD